MSAAALTDDRLAIFLTDPRRLTALAAITRATASTQQLAEFAREGDLAAEGVFHEEVVELLCDAAKLAIEIEMATRPDPDDHARAAVYAALTKFLEGWA